VTKQLESTAITRKPYSEEFKREAVELLRTSGRPLAQIARELGVSAESLRFWRKQAELDVDEREELSSDEREGPRRLRNHMFKRKRIWVSLVAVGAAAAAAAVFLLVAVAGGDEDDGPAGTPGQAAKAEQPVEGSFVGEVSGTEAFVAVVAEPAGDNQQNRRQVQVYVADGDSLSEWFSGSISDNSFAAPFDDGDGEVKGKLSRDSVAGTVELPDGETARYTANRPGGAAGLYDLSVSRRGKLTGASAGGLGLRGTIKLPEGTGTLRLADGRRLKLNISEAPATDLAHLGAGEARLIVLANGEIRGAGKSRASAGTGAAGFFITSS
jgi:transposase-like protein